MPRKLPLHVTREKTRHGKHVYYFRIGKGERTRLPDLASPDFQEAYKACLSGAPIQQRREAAAPLLSLKWVIERYKESAKWAGYSNATRRQQDLFFQEMISKSGKVDFRLIRKADIQDAVDERVATPAKAINFLKAITGLCAWAQKAGYIEIDPALNVEKPKYKAKGFEMWTKADIEAFEARWPMGTKPRLAYELLTVTGLRRGDICRIGPQHMDGNIMHLSAMKTGTPITLEFPQWLMDLIAQTETASDAFIANEHGRKFTKESFGNWFGERCREAGVTKSAHGLRKLSATMSAEAGATTNELMAQYGWVTTQQAELYTRGADRKAMGITASRRISDKLAKSKSRTTRMGSGEIEKNTDESKHK